VAGAESYLHAKFYLRPSNRLATIHQRYRQTDRTGQTGQRSDSIGRTVLQTVTQAPLNRSRCGLTWVHRTKYWGGERAAHWKVQDGLPWAV